ncbi:MAG: hypothetical protein QOD60_2223 [Solirubrobacterales bacterium]|jgi:hypothetical protein|nr:hypothetical protein [Solirubrobacterales bacterium]
MASALDRRQALGVAALLAFLALAVFAAPSSGSAKTAHFHACKSPGPVDQVDESGNKVHFQVAGLTAAPSIKCGKARGVSQRYVTSSACAPDCKIGSLRCNIRTGKRSGYGCRRKSGRDAIRFQIADSGQ